MAEETATPPTPAARPWHTLTTPLAAGIGALTTLIGLLVLAWAILFVTKGRFLKHTFENIVAGQTHRQVKVAGDFQFYLNPFNIKLVAEGMTISNPEWAGTGNFFEASRIDTNLATFTLLFGRRRVNWLDLTGGKLDLHWDAARERNTWTFGDKKTKGKPLELPLIRRATVAGTQIHYADPRMKIAVDVKVQTVEARDTRIASTIRFAGTGTLRDTPFTMNGSLLSPNATVVGGSNKLELHAQGLRTRLDITGTLPGATEIEDSDLHMLLRGSNIADAFSLIGVTLPETRIYRLTSALTKHGNEWRLTGIKSRFGDSDLSGRLTVRMTEPRLMLLASLDTRVLDIVDAGPFIGYNPQRLQAQGAVTHVNGAPRVLPDAPLNVEALKNFDAKVDWHVRTIRAPSLPISNVTLGLTLDNRLLSLSPLNFAMARGTVSSDIVINARKMPVVTDYDARLSPTPMGVLLAGWGVAEAGTSGTIKARLKLTGVGNTVHDSLSNSAGRIAVIIPKGTFWTRNVQLSELDFGVFVQKMFEKKLKEPVQINCGLIGFTVRNGIGAADPILIDTAGNTITGRGGFSFRNESLDLAFEADSKKFSIFSGQSPVGLNGYFAAPKINPISGELLARAGVGLGLGLVASPFAAIIAFVDVGDAKAADCGPVLAGASARAQRDTKGRPRTDVGKGTTAKSESGKQSKGEAGKQRKRFLGIF